MHRFPARFPPEFAQPACRPVSPRTCRLPPGFPAPARGLRMLCDGSLHWRARCSFCCPVCLRAGAGLWACRLCCRAAPGIRVRSDAADGRPLTCRHRVCGPAPDRRICLGRLAGARRAIGPCVGFSRRFRTCDPPVSVCAHAGRRVIPVDGSGGFRCRRRVVPCGRHSVRSGPASWSDVRAGFGPSPYVLRSGFGGHLCHPALRRDQNQGLCPDGSGSRPFPVISGPTAFKNRATALSLICTSE